MNCYMGIDIGTTNCKALIVGGNGDLIKTLSRKTQYKNIGGIRFFDLECICSFVDEAETEAAKLGTLRSVGFSSVGESTVPVSKDGKALFDPVLWSEQSVTSDSEESAFIVRRNTFGRIGISQNGLLALDKILWFRRHYPETAKKAETYLPLTSYLVFRKTGMAAWDYSQALRSNAFLVHERCWDEDLLSHFGLKPFGRLCPMGTAMGEKGGVVYGLGGHDHITGLYGIHSLMPADAPSFFYESMGTSAVLTLCLGENEKNFPSLATYDPPEGSFIPGFLENEFILTRSFRRFGKLNSLWLKLAGKTPSSEVFSGINREISSRPYKGLALMLECDSDFIRGNTKDAVLNFHHFDPDADLIDCIQSTYLYLSVGAYELEKALRSAIGYTLPLPTIAGGAVTHDELFMTLRATAVGHDIICLGNQEISALGAVFVGLNALGDKNAFDDLSRSTMKNTVCYHPDERYKARIDDARASYERLKESLAESCLRK